MTTPAQQWDRHVTTRDDMRTKSNEKKGCEGEPVTRSNEKKGCEGPLAPPHILSSRCFSLLLVASRCFSLLLVASRCFSLATWLIHLPLPLQLASRLLKLDAKCGDLRLIRDVALI